MNTAERTRAAVTEHPFLIPALRAGLVNFRAVARFLDVGDEDTVASALRRYANELGPLHVDSHDVRITIHRDSTEVTSELSQIIALEEHEGEADHSALVLKGATSIELLVSICTRAIVSGYEITALGFGNDGVVFIVPTDRVHAFLRLAESCTTNATILQPCP